MQFHIHSVCETISYFEIYHCVGFIGFTWLKRKVLNSIIPNAVCFLPQSIFHLKHQNQQQLPNDLFRRETDTEIVGELYNNNCNECETWTYILHTLSSEIPSEWRKTTKIESHNSSNDAMLLVWCCCCCCFPSSVRRVTPIDKASTDSRHSISLFISSVSLSLSLSHPNTIGSVVLRTFVYGRRSSCNIIISQNC